eukprot:1716635-Pleurochrysis_carterae.AAC.1
MHATVNSSSGLGRVEPPTILVCGARKEALPTCISLLRLFNLCNPKSRAAVPEVVFIGQHAHNAAL